MKMGSVWHRKRAFCTLTGAILSHSALHHGVCSSGTCLGAVPRALLGIKQERSRRRHEFRAELSLYAVLLVAIVVWYG